MTWQAWWFGINYGIVFIFSLFSLILQPTIYDRLVVFSTLLFLGVSTYALHTLGLW